ncbi:hypothetical protein MLD38_002306 [Melastoma candidum]|uniref:Uncharacterized protein n=1 Tax=Melastoma candidum TaxID=119954 RepID=A0ACB9SFE2_9MYRT|nr:hypothetical protein MLD38_002306 [Melastoma candidum]
MASDSDLEVFGINQDILDSLLEETQGDEQDDVRLNSVIRSLEAEINPNLMVEYCDLLAQVELVGEPGMDSSSAGGTGGAGAGADMDFSWIELDMDRMGLGTSPSEDLNWDINMNHLYGENMGEFEMGEYSQFSYPAGFFYLEEQTPCRPLWQANCDDML